MVVNDYDNHDDDDGGWWWRLATISIDHGNDCKMAAYKPTNSNKKHILCHKWMQIQAKKTHTCLIS